MGSRESVVRHPDGSHDIFIDPPIASIANLVQSQFRDSLSRDLIVLYASEDCQSRRLPFSSSAVVLCDAETGKMSFSGTSEEAVLWLTPDLATKPGPSETPRDLTSKPVRDVFGGEFGPGEEVARFHQASEEYRVVLNLHSVIPEHFMLLPRAWRPQSSELNEHDLLMAYKIVNAYNQAGREVVCFFNAGNRSGASQPHLHVQLAPFFEVTPAPIKLARTLGKLKPGTLLPVGHVNYVSPLSFVKDVDDAQISSQLHETYSNLLKTMRDRLQVLVPGTDSQDHSYNLLLTHDAMHLIPRSRGIARIPDRNNPASTRLYSLNALAYLGYLLAMDDDDVENWKEYTIERALIEGSYDRQQWESDSSS